MLTILGNYRHLKAMRNPSELYIGTSYRYNCAALSSKMFNCCSHIVHEMQQLKLLAPDLCFLEAY